MPFLEVSVVPVPRDAREVTPEVSRRVASSVVSAGSRVVSAGSRVFLYDVAISFAGEQRDVAETLATDLKAAGLRVFIDSDFSHDLLGKDLAVTLQTVYAHHARHCVVLVSKEYVTKMWPNHERQAAVERRMRELGSDYVLPIKVDDIDLPGVPGTVSHLSLRSMDIRRAAAIIVRKLQG
jgi:hypothetical protein